MQAGANASPGSPFQSGPNGTGGNNDLAKFAVAGTLQRGSERGNSSRFLDHAPVTHKLQSAVWAAPESNQPPLRVLVVDDDEANRLDVHQLLTRSGFDATAVAGGQECLVALRNAQERGEPFDIALLDDDMPGMDGELVALEIKADPTLAGIALLMFTSADAQAESTRTLLAGLADIVERPVRQSQLLRSLARKRGHLPAAEPPPRWQAAADPGPQAASLSTPATPAQTSAASAPALDCRAHVLLADDSPVNQKIVMRMLQKLACAVDLASDGNQAVAMAAAAHYDLIFMDCQMPVMDGFEATAVLRRNEPTHHTPIIALTANTLQADKDRCLQAGMNGHLTKPIHFSDLTNALRRWVPALAPKTA